MAAARRYFTSSKTRIFTVLCGLLLVLVIWGYGHVKASSYARLVPMSVELQVLTKVQQNLILQYDYGYGFNESHQQLKQLQPAELPISIDFSVSAWKQPRALRVVVADAEQISLRSVNLQRAGNMVRLLAPARPDNQPDSVILWLEDIPTIFSGSELPESELLPSAIQGGS